ncbi:hypothetical protein M3P05_15640 [Sansalvadorimonas sp. 2012CJ34-2]|uniref:Fork-head domain-containing protein n=1 Tax=Parendozoicomonas callyspongiae TaxID=2942213 RepID=A0ABT0PJ19_9GAMM|nr:hypothetical protein [Sansalvadorimonas sp. 2012CJ34-2]MCL6271353.1 hypothetical protein [Sansalvadorimonas sp. 2012CJ34-2]
MILRSQVERPNPTESHSPQPAERVQDFQNNRSQTGILPSQVGDKPLTAFAVSAISSSSVETESPKIAVSFEDDGDTVVFTLKSTQEPGTVEEVEEKIYRIRGCRLSEEVSNIGIKNAIAAAICSKEDNEVTLHDIYTWMNDNITYYKNTDNQGKGRWRNSVRQSLSSYEHFKKLPKTEGLKVKMHYWTLKDHKSFFEESLLRSNNKGENKHRKRKYQVFDGATPEITKFRKEFPTVDVDESLTAPLPANTRPLPPKSNFEAASNLSSGVAGGQRQIDKPGRPYQLTPCQSQPNYIPPPAVANSGNWSVPHMPYGQPSGSYSPYSGMYGPHAGRMYSPYAGMYYPHSGIHGIHPEMRDPNAGIYRPPAGNYDQSQRGHVSTSEGSAWRQ